jgi:hydrogenase maturation protein HypF
MSAPAIIRRIIHAEGTVQGVGFRPFVYRRAVALGLAGTVRNELAGVCIDVEGARAAVDALVDTLRRELPAAARLARLDVDHAQPRGASGFAIAASDASGARAALPPPDAAPCGDCEAELRDPADARFRYPFINCTACGPRLSITASLPYDRARTTMAGFPLCAACRGEYADPTSRRFHAEPNACPRCGPTLAFEPRSGAPITGDAAIHDAAAALRAGRIVAIEGVGGFHLACDARDDTAVRRLRARKRREARPFALMAPDLPGIEAHAIVSPGERAALTSPARPIVLLARRAGSDLAPSIAPGLAELGFLLPPSPLHLLLLDAVAGPLVMTSGNVEGEPLARDADEARRRLGAIADAFVVHDRPIVARLDDSIVRVERGVTRVLRRARGCVPEPLALRSPRPILACGADLKSTFCLATGRLAVVSQHLGGLAGPDARAAYREALASWSELLRVVPEVAACDLHPDYASTRFAESLGLPLVRVQHHHAHVAACLAEHDRHDPVVGIVFDGAGYGLDGAAWGGEILVADRRRAVRAAHLRNVRQPGGDAAAREPWRMALAYLDDAGERLDASGAPPERHGDLALLARAARRGVGSPWTSSAGRLFDAVAAMTGVRAVARYEGQAAMELQAAIGPPGSIGDDDEAPYPFRIVGRAPAVIDLRAMVRAIARDVRERRAVAAISARFHVTLAAAATVVAVEVAREHGLRTVVLTGGCFQNDRLAAACEARLDALGIEVLRPEKFPPNDGGVSLGQAAVAAARMEDSACA